MGCGTSRAGDGGSVDGAGPGGGEGSSKTVQRGTRAQREVPDSDSRASSPRENFRPTILRQSTFHAKEIVDGEVKPACTPPESPQLKTPSRVPKRTAPKVPLLYEAGKAFYEGHEWVKAKAKFEELLDVLAKEAEQVAGVELDRLNSDNWPERDNITRWGNVPHYIAECEQFIKPSRIDKVKQLLDDPTLAEYRLPVSGVLRLETVKQGRNIVDVWFQSDPL